MERRNFLKLSASAGLALVAPPLSAQKAGESFYEGPFLVTIKADGGWDPTYLCDPQGVANPLVTDDRYNMINRLYREGDIGIAGKLRYAPVGQDYVPPVNEDDKDEGPFTLSCRTFFDRYYEQLLVVQGVDMRTNNHTTGKRYFATGRIENAKYPTIGALYAAARAPEQALSYISFGGWSSTGNLLGVANVGKMGVFGQITQPDRHKGRSGEPTINSPYALQRVHESLHASRTAKAQRRGLPREKRARSLLYTAQLSSEHLARMMEHVEGEVKKGNSPRGNLAKQAELALAAFRGGIAVSADLRVDHFDTHDDHDEKHVPLLTKVLFGVDYLMTRAAELGIAEQLVVMIGSDFSRTPRYNDGNGKDHWPVSSTLFLGRGIAGNREIGATVRGTQEAMRIDPQTLTTTDDEAGIVLKPEHLHRALRKLLNIHEHPLAEHFELEAQDLPLFG